MGITEKTQRSSSSNLRRRSQSGQSLITVTVSIAVLIAFAGLATDVGYLEFVKRQMQTAADSGAIAGAQEILRNQPSQIQPAALHDTDKNGYPNGTNNISVTVNNPPASGYYAGDNSAVEVIVQQPNQPLTFLSILGVTPATVAARAVAHLGAGNGCLIALSGSDRGAVTFEGTANVNLNNCTVVDNSTDCSALVANGGAQVTASGFDVAGNCPGYTGSVPGNYNTTPSTGLLPSPDPLASLPAPALGTCQTFNPANTVISPGTYCGGINIPNGNYTFQPGTYIMNGGGLTISGGTSTGTGVFFYLTGTTSGAPSTRYGPVTIAGNATVTFSAPSSGTYASILFYQNRSLSLQGPQYNSSITGSSGSNFDGVMYFPTSNVVFTGTTGTTSDNTAIIAWTLKIAGTPSFNGNFTAMPGGAAVKMVVLGE
ncbi:MAG: pilus assembly protein TadG-related protein [Terriglobales bacterium]